jgi:enoyl-CoA hydratase
MKKRECDLLATQWDAPAMLTDPEKIGKMVLYEVDHEKKIAWIITNRPETLNALPLAALELIGDYVKEAESDNDVKVIIFKGNGPCFGTGADASELGHYIGYKSGRTAEERRRPAQRQRMLPDRNIVFGAFERVIMECLKATISQVHSYCYGGHFQMAMASDIIVATEDAMFTHPAFRYLGPLGDFSWWIDQGLTLKKLKEITLTGRALTAREAEQLGIVNKVVPREELEQWTLDFAQAIAVQPLDGIMVGKALMLANMEARGKSVGSVVSGWIGHGWITNLSFDPGDWSFMKARRDKGLSEALKERDEIVAPYFRLSHGRRKE